MALEINNEAVERLAEEVSKLANETIIEAIRTSLEERKLSLSFHSVEMDRGERAFGSLEREVWPYLPENVLGKRISKDEKEELLCFGPTGV